MNIKTDCVVYVKLQLFSLMYDALWPEIEPADHFMSNIHFM